MLNTRFKILNKSELKHLNTQLSYTKFLTFLTFSTTSQMNNGKHTKAGIYITYAKSFKQTGCMAHTSNTGMVKSWYSISMV